MKYDPELIKSEAGVNRLLKSINADGSILLGDDGRGKYVVTVFNRGGEAGTQVGGTRNETEGLLAGMVIALILAGARE